MACPAAVVAPRGVVLGLFGPYLVLAVRLGVVGEGLTLLSEAPFASLSGDELLDLLLGDERFDRLLGIDDLLPLAEVYLEVLQALVVLELLGVGLSLPPDKLREGGARGLGLNGGLGLLQGVDSGALVRPVLS